MRCRSLLAEADHEGQSRIEATHIAGAETADRSSYPLSRNGDRLVGHHLRADPQAVHRARFDRNSEIDVIPQDGRHLTDDDGSMVFGKRIRLHDHSGSWFAVIARRGDVDYVTAAYRHRNR